jgi:predicted RNA-binding protein YlqC (UPF0109 family)
VRLRALLNAGPHDRELPVRRRIGASLCLPLRPVGVHPVSCQLDRTYLAEEGPDVLLDHCLPHVADLFGCLSCARIDFKTHAAEQSASFAIDVHPDAPRKIIGRQGRKAKSLRTIVSKSCTGRTAYAEPHPLPFHSLLF